MRDGLRSWTCYECNLSGEGGEDALGEHIISGRHIRAAHKHLLMEARDAVYALREFESEHGLDEEPLVD